MHTEDTRPAFWSYLASSLICGVALIWALQLDQADFRVPFYYTVRGDNFEHAMWLKTTADHGWYLNNPRLGAPDGMDLHDYPLSDSVHFATVRLIRLFTTDYGVILNVFFLVGFPLAAWSAQFVLRWFGVSVPVSMMAGVLYSFLPYHFLRGQCHILLSGYFAVPLMVLVVLKVWRGEPLFGSWKQGLGTVAICAAMPATGVYYAFFGAFFLAVAAAARMARLAERRTVLDTIAALVLIGGSLGAQLAPSMIYFAKHGRSPEVAKRTAWEAEHFGLKIHQLLMPTLGHRLTALQKFGIHGVIQRGEYQKISMNDINENETSSLGVVGVMGFFALIAALFVPKREDDPIVPLSRLNIAAILFGTVGGLGVIFSRLVSTQIRAYNRISVYIAFFALFASALILDGLIKRWANSPERRVMFLIGLALLLAAGIWDQSPAAMVPDHQHERLAFAQDAVFVRQIEVAILERPRVFQLPYVPFPESLPVVKMRDYDHLWGFFHSNRLSWSYGAIKGRETDRWQKETASKSVVEMVETLKQKGFGGITVDRFGYSDEGKAIESELRRVTGSEPIVGPGERVVFFKIPSAS